MGRAGEAVPMSRRALPRPGPAPAPVAPPEGRAAPPTDIPPEVWAVLQEAGERAAQRLLELLDAATFPALPAATRARLIELALTRAYGLPVRRSISVDLSATDADAVAAALLDLHAALPERAQDGPRAPRDVSPPPDA